jgi:putative membrane protein
MDLILAFLHHIGVFAVFGVLLAEFVLLRLSPRPEWVRLIVRVDLFYGIAAAVVLLAGIARIAWGPKGSGFYTGNPVFWFKLGLFLLIGLISVLPTLQYIGWRRRLDADSHLPDMSQVSTARRWVHVQLALFASLPLLAATMARGIWH